MLECVIFDLDELIVDSEPLQFRAYREALAHFDFELTHAIWARWHALEASPRRWIEAAGLRIGPEALRSRKKRIYDAMIADALQFKPGVSALVDELASTHRLCVASGSRRESIEGCLVKFSLLDHFDHLCSVTEVKNSRPYPDVYLHALDLMQVNANATVASEDSPTELAAATRAGINCVVCADSFLAKPAAAYADAPLLVASLTQVTAEMLEQLLIGTYDDRYREPT